MTTPQPKGFLSHFKPAIIAAVIWVLATGAILLFGRSLAGEGLRTALYHYMPSGWTRVQPPSGAAGALRVTPGGDVWVAQDSPDGLSRFRNGAWQHYGRADFGTQSSHIWGGFAVDGDRVWASVEEGVLSFDGQKWRLWREVGRSSRGRAIVAHNGEAWVLDSESNLSRFSGGAWRRERVDLPGASWRQTMGVGEHVILYAGGTLWIAWDGLWRFDGKNWRSVGALPKDVEPASAITDHVWMMHRDQLWQFDFDGRLMRTLRPTDLGFSKTGFFWAVAETGGRLVVASYEGLAAFEGGVWKHLPDPAHHINDAWRMAFAPDGSLWAICLLPGSAPNRGTAIAVLALGVAVIPGFFVVPYLFVKGNARRKLADRERMRTAVQHATGAVPEELVGDPEVLKVTPLRWALRALLSIGAALGSTIVLRRYWPSAAPFGFAGGIVMWELTGVVMRNLKRREAKAWDPIGPGGPPRYNLSKAAKPILGGLLLLAILYAIPHGWFSSPLIIVPAVFVYELGIAFAIQHFENQARYDAALRLAPFLDPTTAGKSFNRGEILTMAGRYQEAERMLRLGIERSGTKTSAFALVDLGNVLMDTGRYAEALRAFEGASEIKPAHSASWRGRAELLLREGLDPTQALDHAETALRLYRASVRERLTNRTRMGVTLSAQAWALAACGRGADARQAIEKALKSPARRTSSPLAHIHYNAGMALIALSDHACATAHFRRAAELDPEGRWGRLAASMLRERASWHTAGA
jgi:tetratricopeptide (TPR) repeat protein